MDVYEAVRTRKSVRSFLDRAVEAEKLQRVLEAARLAPSASNRQEWRFVVVTDPQKREQLARAAGQGFIGRAPAIIVACAETDGHVMRCGQRCYPIDVAIALDHLTLAAVSEGLGTCWIGSFSPDRVREALGIPAEIEVVELMPLGYPADAKRIAKDRLPLERIARFERW